MKAKIIKIFLFASLIFGIIPKSQDYGRHIELSLLFYECQRSGPLPENNRIYWRHDSMVDAGKDVGLDLTGGYYDAGDNVKFNYPQAATMTLLAWSGIEFPDGYKKSGQWDYFKDAVKWGMDYFIKCHPEKNVLWAQVGDGSIDHGHWYPPEYINYDYPSFKIDESSPGTELAAETAASFAAASLMFKEEDSAYSATLAKHAVELYDFADKFRGDYTKSVPAGGFYNSWSGYRDEIAWGGLWLYKLTGEEKYYDSFKEIADATYDEQDTKKYLGNTGPMSWDDKRAGAYILAAMLTKDEGRMKVAYDYCDLILSQPRTPGGLWYDSSLSQWASNRYAANAASVIAVFANWLPESDPKRKGYIDFVQGQIDYILGDNPAGINYVVGAEENSPRAVHHRAASATYDSTSKPSYNVYTLYGALAGGPGKDDSFKDDRGNYQMNEVALDYNAGFTLCLAALVHFGLGKKDAPVEFDRSWPQRAPTPDITIEVSGDELLISTGSGMLCSGWCVEFESEAKIGGVYDCTTILSEHPKYIFCNKRETNFLDGAGTPQKVKMSISGNEKFVAPKEYTVMCDGFHHAGPTYKPEYGHKYKVTGTGGPSNTKPLFEETKCWPEFIC